MSFDPSRLTDPDMMSLYVYWDGKRRDRAMPARQDIDPGEIVWLLPHLMLVDVEGPPPEFRMRLIGTAIVQRFGQELTGRYLREIDLDGVTERIQAEYEDVVRSRQPRLDCNEFARADGRYMHYWRLLLPLSGNGVTVNMLLGMHKAIGLDGTVERIPRRL